jgi:hypothetical protein
VRGSRSVDGKRLLRIDDASMAMEWFIPRLFLPGFLVGVVVSLVVDFPLARAVPLVFSTTMFAIPLGGFLGWLVERRHEKNHD